MQDLFVDVTFEVPAPELAKSADPSRFVFEMMRDRADALCAENGARLRTDRAPELQISQAVDLRTGLDMVLCAGRWPVVVPDSVAAAV